MLLFTWYSHGFGQSVPCTAIPPTARISEIGAFSNMRSTEEHLYGHSVLLWRSGNCVFGLFESSEGLAGDTPIGELQAVRLNPNTGKLAFSAKLTMGVVTVAGSTTAQPSRDLFRFDGSLGATRLIGVLIYVNQADSAFVPERSTIVLTASATDATFMHGSVTYGAWREKWQPILARRGPRW
jgi:hypothetical protein